MPVHPHNDENFDRTTGMMKKDTFIEQARQHIESGEAVDGEKLTMLVIEGLEKLKAQKGQEAVDDFLRRLSERLRARSLAGDTVGLLGDGKIGVLHDSDVTEEIIRIEADSLSKEIAGETGADISVGGYSLDLSIENISKDDAAKSVAYALRQFSRGNHALTSVNVHQSATELLKSTSARLKDMAKTPLARSFKLALQPVVNLETRVIDHYEALTRFEGYQTPAQMISYSDRKDVLEDFDLLMIQRTLELLVKIEKEDKWQPTISVNISAKSLDSDIFVKQIGMLLMQQGLLQNSVAFEIGDVDEATDIPRLNRVIQRLRMNENQVYLDRMDIGNRYMQLAQNLQIDGIKISGPNVHKNLSSAEGKEQFKAFCKLCKRHKISVVAEAIEAEQDSIDLVSIGVEMGQGDLFGLPMINVKQRTFADTTNNKSSGSARNW
jgi:EAL domain-containing protein (putative c-di-GMP-specific phosphodiesterase class I)